MELVIGVVLGGIVGFLIGLYFLRRGSTETPDWVKRELIPMLKKNAPQEIDKAKTDRAGTLAQVEQIRSAVRAARKDAQELPTEAEAWGKLEELVRSVYEPLITSPPSGQAVDILENWVEASHSGDAVIVEDPRKEKK